MTDLSGFIDALIQLERIDALFDPIKHPRDPETGKFVERPYPVPDDISGLDTKQIIGELAAANDNFAEQVEGIAVDINDNENESAVPTELQELIDNPDAGSGGSVEDIEQLSIDGVSEGDRIRVDGMPATVTGKNEAAGRRRTGMEVAYEPDIGRSGTINYDDDEWGGTGRGETSVTSVGPDAEGFEQYGSGGEFATGARLLQTKYGPKVGFDTPFEAKEAIKELDFDETHRSWNGDIDEWTVDLSAVDEMREKLVNEGYRVRVKNDILQAAEQA